MRWVCTKLNIQPFPEGTFAPYPEPLALTVPVVYSKVVEKAFFWKVTDIFALRVVPLRSKKKTGVSEEES